MQELNGWLAMLPVSIGRTLLTCTPADVLVFTDSYFIGWLPMLAQSCRWLMIASPSGLSSCLAHLSTGFDLIGRAGEWDPASSSGNPLASTDLSHYRQGYKKEAWRAGYLAGSAVPMKDSKGNALTDYLDACIASKPAGLEQLILQRDAMLCLLMWETPRRGHDCGRVSHEDLFTPEGQPILSCTGQLQGVASTLPVGFQLSLRPNETKTTKCQRSGPFMLSVTDTPQHCFLARLPSYPEHRFPDGLITSKYLFSPLAAHHRSFVDGPMQATSIGHRLNKHLEAAGLYAGESNHGFRRGQIQGMASQGMTKPQIGEAVQIKTMSIVELYADVTRHQPRLQRLSKRKHAALSSS